MAQAKLKVSIVKHIGSKEKFFGIAVLSVPFDIVSARADGQEVFGNP